MSDDTSLATAELATAGSNAAVAAGALSHSLERTSELGALIRTKVWSATPIGALEQWSPALKTKAHDILTREHWEGASLRKIVSESLAPHASNGSEHRLRFGGPEIRLWPKAALALSMALHELATNAVKYGAFSNADGTVRVDWSVGEDGLFALRWIEEDGPPVSSPGNRGFGSRLIEQGLSQDLGGAVSLAFPSSGVVCSIRAPLIEVGGR